MYSILKTRLSYDEMLIAEREGKEDYFWDEVDRQIDEKLYEEDVANGVYENDIYG